MSADNWNLCPNCEIIENKRMEDKSKKLKAQYGKISQEEYTRKILFSKEDNISLGKNLREDYEFHLEDGILEIVYVCHCNKCGFKFEFSKDIDILEGK